MHWNSGHKSECHKLTTADSPIVNNGIGIEDLTVSKIGKIYVAFITDHKEQFVGMENRTTSKQTKRKKKKKAS